MLNKRTSANDGDDVLWKNIFLLLLFLFFFQLNQMPKLAYSRTRTIHHI